MVNTTFLPDGPACQKPDSDVPGERLRAGNPHATRGAALFDGHVPGPPDEPPPGRQPCHARQALTKTALALAESIPVWLMAWTMYQ